MAFYVKAKSAPSSANKAASGVSTRMSKNAGKATAGKTGKGHFAAAAGKVAKMRSGILQHGIPKHAPTGASNIGGSKMMGQMGKMMASEGQTALNKKQQGASSKNMQTDGFESEDE